MELELNKRGGLKVGESIVNRSPFIDSNPELSSSAGLRERTRRQNELVAKERFVQFRVETQTRKKLARLELMLSRPSAAHVREDTKWIDRGNTTEKM